MNRGSVSELPQALHDRVSDSIRQLRGAVATHGKVCYATSLGAESMVLTDLVWTEAAEIDVFTVDTGRLFPETHDLIERLEHRYGQRLKILHPDARAVESWVTQHGINGFRTGTDERRGCCAIRKVEPFRRGIAGYAAWVTGIRAEQSDLRASAQPSEWDAENGLYKVSPMLDWSDAEVWQYIRAKRLPYHSLHDAGFPSIGCAPCTRAVTTAGADPRSGRWWWERDDSRECGLHPRSRLTATATATATATR